MRTGNNWKTATTALVYDTLMRVDSDKLGGNVDSAKTFTTGQLVNLFLMMFKNLKSLLFLPVFLGLFFLKL